MGATETMVGVAQAAEMVAQPQTNRQQSSANAPDGQQRENVWRENKSFDATLKTTKQKIEQQHGCTYLSHLLKTGGTSIPEALNNLGLNIKQCRRYMLWGGCGNQNCMLAHDDTPLSTKQLGVLVAILMDSATKLPVIKTEN